MKLSDRQLEIINHEEGALLVMASAGSGKTKVLTERIKKLLEKDGSFHILALTFTNKAAKEMIERLDGVPNIEKRSFIGTIHSFCQEIIEKHGHSIGLTETPQIFEKNEDRLSILIQVFEKHGNEDLRKFYANKTPQEQEKFIYNALTYISLKKKNLKGVEKFDVNDKDIDNRNIQKMYREYNDLLREQNAMDFDDVIINAYKIFAERPSVARIYRNLYKYISIDEAQDLNFAQYELIKLLCNGEHKNVLMVGDSNQSLYHFNGSDKKFMEDDFVKDFRAKKDTLLVNYRSSKAIIELANKIKKNSMSGYRSDINGEFAIIPCENEEQEAKCVVDKIKELLNRGVYQEGDFEEEILEKDIVVLARSRFLFKYIEVELEGKNIPYFQKKNGDALMLDSSFIQVFDLGLRVLINPYDKLHFIEITKSLNIDFNEKFEQDTDGFHKLKCLQKYVSKEWLSYYEVLMQSWEILNQKDRFKFRDALGMLKEYANKLEDLERESILYDIVQYEEFWNIYVMTTNAELKSLQHFKTQIALGLISPKLDENGITLSTIHLAKGLEFKVVFVIGMTEGAFPDYRAIKTAGQTLEEEKNAFYVAVTRAERILFITYPKTRFMPWDKETPKKQSFSSLLREIGYNEN